MRHEMQEERQNLDNNKVINKMSSSRNSIKLAEDIKSQIDDLVKLQEKLTIKQKYEDAIEIRDDINRLRKWLTGIWSERLVKHNEAGLPDLDKMKD